MTSSAVLTSSHTTVARPDHPLHIMGETVFIRLTGNDTGGAYSVIEDVTPPGGGPPLHAHTFEDELFHVLEGEYELRVGDQVMHAAPGAYVYAPRNVPHSFRNVSAGPSRMMIVFSPPGFERFFEEVHQAGPEAPFETVVGLAAKYGNHALDPRG